MVGIELYNRTSQFQRNNFNPVTRGASNEASPFCVSFSGIAAMLTGVGSDAR